jgi:hypothetical protein
VLAGRTEQPGDGEVAFRGWRRSDGRRAIGRGDVRGLRIRVRVHRDRLDRHFAARPDDAKGDFAAVGYEKALDHAVIFTTKDTKDTKVKPLACTP